MDISEPSPHDFRERPGSSKANAEDVLSSLERISKISAKALGSPSREVAPDSVNFAPINFGRRIVLRSEDAAPVELIVRLHDLYKTGSAAANEILTTLLAGEPTTKLNNLMYCSVRTHFEE